MKAGAVLFVLGANGTGKSTLLHRFFTPNRARAWRMSAHRQTWFNSGSVSITGEQRTSTESNIRSWDVQSNARWLEVAAQERANIAVYDLVDAQNVRARAIAEAVDSEQTEFVKKPRQTDAPLKLLNELLKLSAIPIVISLRSSDELVASKTGSEQYSIAELSDGERNVLLLPASVLTAKAGTLMLIDEPERHLHRAISSRLLSLLFARRPDCVFVVSTHDIMLPLDSPTAKTLLTRSCSRDASGSVTWEMDLLDAAAQLDGDLVGDILGARRNVLFVEGTKRSLDLPLYSLLFPRASVIPKASCREVEQAVVGIRAAESMHWVRAFGIVDGDARPAEELASLLARGIHPLHVYSIESVYYHPTVQMHVAQRQAAVIGNDANAKLVEAKQAALEALGPHKQRLSERVAEKTVREAIMKRLPGRENISAGEVIDISIDISAYVTAEIKRFADALAASDLATLIARYPVRETPALVNIASHLGFQNRAQYESAVRKVLLDDETALAFVRGLFGALAADLS